MRFFGKRKRFARRGSRADVSRPRSAPPRDGSILPYLLIRSHSIRETREDPYFINYRERKRHEEIISS